MDARIERLKELLLQRAVQFGEFTLASGKKSDVYVDGRLLTLSPRGAALVAELLWEKIEPLGLDAVGGMTMGADPMVGALVHLAGTKGSDLSGFLIRKEPKGHGTKRSVEGPRPDKQKPRVVLVEDTTTTGGSTLKAVQRVREEWNAEVVAVFCIVDREQGAVEAYAAEGLTLTVSRPTSNPFPRAGSLFQAPPRGAQRSWQRAGVGRESSTKVNPPWGKICPERG
ncbi:MAG: orotate phosphoribosyltransferase [Planctomycetota bacterium]